MNSKENIKSLWKQIENNRIQAVGGRHFVPRSALIAIFTPPAITKAVAELTCELEDRIGLPEAIRNGGIITFAILVWMHREEAIVEFRRRGLFDSRGPLDESTALSVAPEFGRTFSKEAQWEFRPYILRRGEDVEIDPLEILPYVQLIAEHKGGGYGAVAELTVHPSHQDFYPDKVRRRPAGFPKFLGSPRKTHRARSNHSL